MKANFFKKWNALKSVVRTGAACCALTATSSIVHADEIQRPFQPGYSGGSTLRILRPMTEEETPKPEQSKESLRPRLLNNVVSAKEEPKPTRPPTRRVLEVVGSPKAAVAKEAKEEPKIDFASSIGVHSRLSDSPPVRAVKPTPKVASRPVTSRPVAPRRLPTSEQSASKSNQSVRSEQSVQNAAPLNARPVGKPLPKVRLITGTQRTKVASRPIVSKTQKTTTAPAARLSNAAPTPAKEASLSFGDLARRTPSNPNERPVGVRIPAGGSQQAEVQDAEAPPRAIFQPRPTMNSGPRLANSIKHRTEQKAAPQRRSLLGGFLLPHGPKDQSHTKMAATDESQQAKPSLGERLVNGFKKSFAGSSEKKQATSENKPSPTRHALRPSHRHRRPGARRSTTHQPKQEQVASTQPSANEANSTRASSSKPNQTKPSLFGRMMSKSKELLSFAPKQQTQEGTPEKAQSPKRAIGRTRRSLLSPQPRQSTESIAESSKQTAAPQTTEPAPLPANRLPSRPTAKQIVAKTAGLNVKPNEAFAVSSAAHLKTEQQKLQQVERHQAPPKRSVQPQSTQQPRGTQSVPRQAPPKRSVQQSSYQQTALQKNVSRESADETRLAKQTQQPNVLQQPSVRQQSTYQNVPPAWHDVFKPKRFARTMDGRLKRSWQRPQTTPTSPEDEQLRAELLRMFSTIQPVDRPPVPNVEIPNAEITSDEIPSGAILLPSKNGQQ